MQLKPIIWLSCTAALVITVITAIHTYASPKTGVSSARMPKLLVKYRQAPGNSRLVYVSDAHSANNGLLTATGDGNGVVSVTNTNINTTVTFQMTAGIPIRQVFFADNGQTVGAAQAGLTIFWSLATGQQIASVAEEAYAFNPNGSKFFSYNATQNSLNIYSYPGLQVLAQFPTTQPGPPAVNLGAPDHWTFSADSSYLAVTLDNTRPSPDVNYPTPIIMDWGHTYQPWIINLSTGQLVNMPNISDFGVSTFTADSQNYEIDGTTYYDANGNRFDGNFDVNLSTGNVISLN